MIAAPRPTPGPQAGDLYLDPAVPEGERVTISRNGWAAQASHVWTGTGWSRLVAGVVREVPAHPAVTLPRASAVRDEAPARQAAQAPSAAGLERYRRRRSARESVQELMVERSAAVEAAVDAG